MKRPNILLITTDQQRWDFFDNRTIPSLKVPALDRLRREGTRLPNVFANAGFFLPGSRGMSYLPHAINADAPARDFVFSEFGLIREEKSGPPPWRMIRGDHWKYVWSPAGEQFYDMAADPMEFENLAKSPEHHERIQEFRMRLMKSLAGCVAV